MGVERFNRPLQIPYLTLVEVTGVRVQMRVIAGAPTDGTSGTAAGQAGPGSLLIDTTNNVLYSNAGTKASPSWVPNGGGVSGAVEVFNETGVTIEDGDLVYISGWDETEAKPNISLADADAQGQPAEYVIRTDIENNAAGLAFRSYRETGGVDLAGKTVGDPLYLSTTPGDATVTDPTDGDPNALSQIVGFVAVVATDVTEYRLDGPLVQIGTNEFQDDSVTNAKQANMTQGTVKVGGAANAPTDLDAKTSGQILVGDGSDVVSVAVSNDATLAADGQLTITNAQAFDAGAPARATLRMASDVVDAETVTIGADVYEYEVVQTDGTDNTQGGDFNNTTDPLTLATFTTDYANVTPVAIGDLIAIESEIMVISAVSGTSRTFIRGVSGTTAATHADGQNVLDGAGTTGSNIAVGLLATLTPTAAMPALVADINNSGRGSGIGATELVLATQISVNELLLQTAATVGGTIAASAVTTATTETLGGVNNEWDTANLRAGKAAGARQISVVIHTVDQTEVDLGAVRVTFPFTVAGFIVQVYDANGLFLEGLTDQFVISGTRVEADGTGGTNPAAGQFIHVIAWD